MLDYKLLPLKTKYSHWPSHCNKTFKTKASHWPLNYSKRKHPGDKPFRSPIKAPPIHHLVLHDTDMRCEVEEGEECYETDKQT